MSSNKEDTSSFKELLDQHYNWPAEYSFKFIVKNDQVSTVLNYFDEDDLVTKRPSSKGSYISLTITKLIKSSDEIIDTYLKLESIKGIIRL